MRMKITWSAEHRSVNTICTKPEQDCERSENLIGYLYIRHHRYDIYRYHKNRQIIVINELEFRTVVLHSHGTSVSYIGLKGLSLLPNQPLNATSLRFTLLSCMIRFIQRYHIVWLMAKQSLLEISRSIKLYSSFKLGKTLTISIVPSSQIIFRL